MRIYACTVAVMLALSPVVLSVSPAYAQASAKDDTPLTETARQRFQEGVRLFDSGKYEEARAAFLQAYALKRHPAVLLNLAQSELHSGHFVDSARHFSQYLREATNADSSERRSAEKSLAEARTKTGRVQISVNVVGADVVVDDELVGRSPLPEPIDVSPGSHKVEVRAAGAEPTASQVSAPMGQVTAVSLTVKQAGQTPTTPAAQAGPTTTEASDANRAAVANAVQSQSGRMSYFEWFKTDKIAWVTGGLAIVGIAGGTILAFASYSASNNADSTAAQIRILAQVDGGLDAYKGNDGLPHNRHRTPCADPVPITELTNYGPACSQLRGDLDSRDTYRTLSIIGWVVAGAGIAGNVTAYFLRTNDASLPQTQVSKSKPLLYPVVGPGMQGLSFATSF